MQLKNKNTSSKRKRPLKSIVAIMLLLGSLALVLFITQKGSQDNLNDAVTNSDQINYSPPTEEEIKAGNDIKDNNLKDSEVSSNQNDSNKKTISVIISNASVYQEVVEVQAFIPSHIEDGTCTITFSKDQERKTKEVPAYGDASSTICTNPNLNKSEFSKGLWTVEVTYNSTKASGKSEAKTLTIE